MTLQAGNRLGSFEILAPLGAGGMGEVYRGRDTRLNRQVAIKVLPTEFSANEERLRRFEQEARSASALNHPNIITIYEIGTFDSRSFIAMELVEGKTLREMLQSGPIQARKALQIATQIADGLSKAHEAGIVHRDLKPENIMLSKDGFAKILDFGLAKVQKPESSEKISILPTAAKTDVGVVLGTVGYMSPEQASGLEIDFRSDQFSFGAILYEMLIGKRAFAKKTNVETLAAIINEDPEPVQSSNREVAPPIRWITDQCLEKHPKDRYASTRDLARDLQNIRDHYAEVLSVTSSTVDAVALASSQKKMRRTLEIAAILLILVLGSALLYLWLAPAKEKPAASIHRVTYRRGPIHSSRFTPDGQTIVYSAGWEGRERELFVTRPDAVESRSLGIPNADVESISSKGEMLLRIHKGASSVLAQASLTGQQAREIAEGISTADWTPDGKNMAVARYSSGKSTLEYPPENVLFQSSGEIRRIRFSPKGNLIALQENNWGSINGRILIIDLNGKQIADSGEIYPNGFSWGNSGNRLFVTNLTGGPGAGMELLSMDLRGSKKIIAPFSWSAIDDISVDNRVLMRIEDRRILAFSVPEGADREKNLTWLDQSDVADFSPDGKKILIHERGEGSESPSGTIYLVNADGTSGVRLAGGNPVEFFPDGKRVLASVGEKETFIVPVGVGKIATIKNDSEKKRDYGLSCFPDGKQILLQVQEENVQTTEILDLASGTRKNLSAKYFPLRRNSISPDGKFVLAVAREVDGPPFIVSLLDGSGRPVPGIQQEEKVVSWTTDGKSIFTYMDYSLPVKIHKINVSTGERTLFKEILPPEPAGFHGFSSVIFSDDEKSYAYSYFVVLGTLYSLENLIEDP